MRPRPILRMLAGLAVVLAPSAAVLRPALAVPASCSQGPEELTDLGVTGDGTAESPFLIATAEQFDEVSDSYRYACVFRQVADIDLTGLSISTIGSAGDPFTGSYDGQRFKIRGLNISETRQAGLFGYVEGATIERVRIVDAVVAGMESGGLVGRVGLGSGGSASGAATLIRDVVVSATVTGGHSIGGLVGYVGKTANLTIEDSAAYGAVGGTGTGRYGVGGLVGYVGSYPNVTISRSYAAVDIEGASSGSGYEIYGVGGIVGIGSLGVVISDTSASGTITSGGIDTVRTAEFGCIVGQSNSTPAPTDTHSSGTVLGSACPTPPAGYVVGAGFKRPELYAAIGEEEEEEEGGGGGSSDPSYVTSSSGLPPAPPTGSGEWQQEDGSVVPLRVSSPGSGQVRYQTDGMVLTLTGSRGTGTGTGLVADRDGNVECELCAFLAAGGVIEAWAFSEPRLVAALSADEIARVLAGLPCRRFTIPVGAPLDGGVGLPPGPHTLQLVLPTGSGLQAVNVGVTVAGPVPGAIPAGDAGASRDASIAAGVLLVVAAGVARRRSRGHQPVG